jgi:hypothetical protein
MRVSATSSSERVERTRTEAGSRPDWHTRTSIGSASSSRCSLPASSRLHTVLPGEPVSPGSFCFNELRFRSSGVPVTGTSGEGCFARKPIKRPHADTLQTLRQGRTKRPSYSGVVDCRSCALSTLGDMRPIGGCCLDGKSACFRELHNLRLGAAGGLRRVGGLQCDASPAADMPAMCTGLSRIHSLGGNKLIQLVISPRGLSRGVAVFILEHGRSLRLHPLCRCMASPNARPGETQLTIVIR